MVKKDRLQMTVEVDGRQGINELGKLEMEARDLQQSMKGLKKDTEEYKAAAKNLDEVKKNMSALRQEMGLTGMTLKQLSSYQRELQGQWNNLTKGTEAWKQVDDQLKKVNDTIAKQRAELKGTSNVWGFLKSEIGKFAAFAVAFLGIEALISKFQNLIAHAAKLSDAMADVRMTTGLSAKAMEQYESQLKGLNTRTSKEDLLGIGKIAGQFGVAKNELRQFTETMNKVVVVMSSEFKGGAEEVTDRMATLRNIFSDIKSENIAEDINHISNAVLVLAQEGVATAPVVTDFANRIGGVGINLGLTTPQVLGLSATMQELGITAERGGTAIGKILQKMTTNTSEFAKVAGMDLQSFSKLVNNDIYGAFLRVLEGSKKGGEGAMILGRLIKDLEIAGAGASEVFSKLGNNMDLLSNRTKLAGDAIQSTSNITEQYNLKNQTFAGNLERVQKAIASWFANGSFMKGLEDMVGYLAKLSEIDFSDTLQKEQVELNVLVGAITSANDEYGTRQRLLTELQEKFPDFLGNLDKEKVTNEQLQVALDAVNREYMKKIFLARNQERLNELAEEELDLREKLAEQNKKLQAAGNDFRVTAGGEVRRIADDIRFDIEQTKRNITELSKERQRYMMEQNALAQELGLNPNLQGRAAGIAAGKKLQGPDKKPGGPEKGGITVDEEAKKAAEQAAKAAEKERLKYEAMLQEIKNGLAKVDDVIEQNGLKREQSDMEKLEKELSIIDNRYGQELLKAGQNWQDIVSNEKLKMSDKIRLATEAQAQLDALELQWKTEREARETEYRAQEELKKQELRQKIELELMNENDREIAQIRMKYEALISEAEKYGLATTAIYEAMYGAITAARNKQAQQEQKIDQKALRDKKAVLQAEIDAYNATANVMGNAIAFLGQIGEENSGFAKALTIAQIAIDTAAAIASVVKNAEANPTNALTGGASAVIQTGAGIARVFAGMNSARQSLNTEIPSAPSIQDWNPDINLTGRYFGGFTGSGTGRGPADQYGEIVGYHHRNEYVAPSFIMHEPAAINAVGVLERLRMNAIATGQTNSSGPAPEFASPNSSGESQMMAMMMQMMEAIKAQGEKPVTFVATDYERFQEEQNKIKFKSQR